MRKKGFTLVELLVVIAIIALLMGILMPALARVRQIAFRMVCGTNLSGIGKAMLIYANDYEDELPVAGFSDSTWGAAGNTQYAALTAIDAFKNNKATITSCFYLLVKYAEVTPKSFICKGDTNASEFELEDQSRDLLELWDFGKLPTRHCSYSYHQPFDIPNKVNTFALTTSSEPALAVAADPNPWITAGEGERDFEAFIPEDMQGSTRDSVKAGNSLSHQDEGQNVLFLDSHVEFENTSYCGINEDNIYTYYSKSAHIQKGLEPASTAVVPQTRQDSLIVNDGAASTKGRTCFLPNTPVWVDGTFVPISTVSVGQAAGTSDTAFVVTLEEHVGMYECRDVVLETGNCISVVESHLFMLESGVWVHAQNLRSGMKLKTMNGPIAIESVTLREMPYVGKVYNVKVSNTHQYMVGEDAVIVRDY